MTDTETKTDAPEVIMLPPVLLLHHIAAGLALNWLAGIYFDRGWGALGLILLLLGYSMCAWGMKTFGKAGTNIRPDKPSLAIVTNGPFRYTRNPMYLGFLFGLAGMSLLASAPLMLLMLVPFWYILDRYVIVPEENYLSQKFGDTYLEYKAKVRRWI
jgi:protein-S-isoprenylcysteine O-methyltransferase Ste14